MYIEISRTAKEYTPLSYAHIDDAMQFIENCHWYYPDIELPVLGMTEEFAHFIHQYCRCKLCKKHVLKSLAVCDCGKQRKLIKVEFPTEIFRSIFEDVLRVQNWADLTERKAFRRKKRLADAGGRYTSFDIEQLFSIQNGCCYYCGTSLSEGNGESNFHIDHYVPVSHGGTNNLSNLVLACPNCNIQKGGDDGNNFVRKTNSSLSEEMRLEVAKTRRKVSRFKANN